MKERIFWQGPSVGFDFGGNGSRALVLVYNSTTPSELHDVRFGGVEGSAYLVGGLGVNYEQRGDIVLAPIRTGVGARLGANIGYLKYTAAPDLEPVLTRFRRRQSAKIPGRNFVAAGLFLRLVSVGRRTGKTGSGQRV